MSLVKQPSVLDRLAVRFLNLRLGAVSSSFQHVPAKYFVFNQWLNQIQPPLRIVQVTPEGYKKNNPEGLTDIDWIKQKLSDESLTTDVRLANSTFVVTPEDINLAESRIRHVIIASNEDSDPIFDKKFESLTLKEGASISIAHCFVRYLYVELDARSLYLSDTWIEHLVLRGNLSLLTIKGGGILKITCSNDSALNGDTKVSTFFPRFINPAHTDLQPFRNLRRNLNTLHNNRAAGFFHAIELSLSRSTDTKLNKAIGWLYEVLSDFGNSTTRPLIWLFVALSSMFTIALINNNIIATTEINESAWQEIFIRTDYWGQLARAFFYPVFSLLNPLGIFSSKPLLNAGQTLWVFAYGPLSILALISLTLFFLSLRRRFRLE